MNTLIEALKQIEQMSDPGSYQLAILRMKSIATDAIKNYAPVPGKEEVKEAIKYFDKAINALALELHDAVWIDFHDRWIKFQNICFASTKQSNEDKRFCDCIHTDTVNLYEADDKIYCSKCSKPLDAPSLSNESDNEKQSNEDKTITTDRGANANEHSESKHMDKRYAEYKNDEPKVVQQAAKEIDYEKLCNRAAALLVEYAKSIKNKEFGKSVEVQTISELLAGASFNSDAVEFAEWCDNNYYGLGNGKWTLAENEYTTEQLYNLFLADKNKNEIQQAHDKSTYE